MQDSQTKILILAGIIGLVAGAVGALAVSGSSAKSDEQIIEEWYAGENLVHVSPHHIRKGMSKGDETFILVDLRSQEEYEEEHIIGAISIPAYKDRDHSDYGATERIIASFSELPTDKDIIVYCYSIPCMTGRKVGNMLAQNGIYVQQLGVGWNEWRYYWELWNHPHEWEITNADDYVVGGSEPGTFDLQGAPVGCPIEGGFGC